MSEKLIKGSRSEGLPEKSRHLRAICTLLAEAAQGCDLPTFAEVNVGTYTGNRLRNFFPQVGIGPAPFKGRTFGGQVLTLEEQKRLLTRVIDNWPVNHKKGISEVALKMRFPAEARLEIDQARERWRKAVFALLDSDQFLD